MTVAPFPPAADIGTGSLLAATPAVGFSPFDVGDVDTLAARRVDAAWLEHTAITLTAPELRMRVQNAVKALRDEHPACTARFRFLHLSGWRCMLPPAHTGGHRCWCPETTAALVFPGTTHVARTRIGERFLQLAAADPEAVWALLDASTPTTDHGYLIGITTPDTTPTALLTRLAPEAVTCTTRAPHGWACATATVPTLGGHLFLDITTQPAPRKRTP